MKADQNNRDARRPPSKLGWIIGGVLVLLLVVFALQGIVRGTGEATGVTRAAPGDDNAAPAPENRAAPR